MCRSGRNKTAKYIYKIYLADIFFPAMPRRKNRSKYSILVMLSIQPMSGYDLKKFANEVLGNFWSESYGQIYSNLKALTNEGLVVSSEEKDGNMPSKKVFAITKQGRQNLEQWLCQPVAEQVPRDELSLKLFAAPLIPEEVILTHLSNHRNEQQHKLDLLQNAIDRMKARVPDGMPHKRFWVAGSRLGVMLREARVKWCDEMESMIRENESGR